jgi:hypothetical protein
MRTEVLVYGVNARGRRAEPAKEVYDLTRIRRVSVPHPKRPALVTTAAAPGERTLQEQQAELMTQALNEPQVLEVREAMEQYCHVPEMAYPDSETVAYFGAGANAS